MEIHAHTHSPGKKLTHYFWEFLMLFLAVFCGFLAEYQLEHKIEKNRERQYMESMLEDLFADTAMLSNITIFATRINIGLDSLQNSLFDTDNVEANTLTIYRLNSIYTRLIVPRFSDQTVEQLRSSGTMRLIRKREVTNAISQYWSGIKGVETMIDLLERRLDEVSLAGYNIFNRKYTLKFRRDLSRSLDIAAVHPKARFMTTDKNSIINYGNRVNRLITLIDGFFIPHLTIQKSRADSLIRLIRKEYHLK